MASGISLFIWVVFFFVIVSKIKNASKGGASAKPNVPRKDSEEALRQMFGAADPTLQRNISEADAAYQQRRRDREAYAQSRTPNAPVGAAAAKPQTTAPRPQTAAAKQQAPAREATAPKQAPPLPQQGATAEKSTTQMLQEKAMLDEAEHRKERWEHDREERKRHGNLKYAQRLYLGDPIPNGKRMVLCSYCNAENLVPAHENASKYNCYFCREYL